MDNSTETPLNGSAITQDEHVQATFAKQEKRKKLIRTIVLYTGFFCLGLGSITGPTLLELQRNTNTTTRIVSFVFTVRSIIGLGGAVLAGFLTDRLNHWMLLSLVIGTLGGLLIAVPHITHIALLMAVFGAVGLCGCFFDAGGNMVLLKVWGEENGPWMQALHFVFGIGSLVGPLLAEPFLPAYRNSDDSNSTGLVELTTMGVNSTSTSHHIDDDDSSSTVVYQSSLGLQLLSNTSTTVAAMAANNVTTMPINVSTNPMALDSDIHWAYLIVGMLSIFSAIFFLFIIFCYSEIELRLCNKLKKTAHHENKVEAEEESEDPGFRMCIIIAVFVFYFVYCILEINYANYLAAYAVKGLGWSEKEGARVSAAYWFTFTAGRALGIFIVKVIPPWAILTIDLSIGMVSLYVLLFFSNMHYLVLWVCTMTLGFGISSMYATGITWTEQYIRVTGAAGAVFMISGAGGEMVGPIVIGALFTTVGPQSFVYVMCAAASCLVVLLAVMEFMGRRHGKRKRPMPASEDTALQQTEDLESEPPGKAVDDSTF